MTLKIETEFPPQTFVSAYNSASCHTV